MEVNKNGFDNMKILNATNIKIIAIILMFFDHVYQMFSFQGAPFFFRILGRPVFIMFLFLAAESFHYTSNRKKYLIRLLLANWIMVAGSLILENTLRNPNVVLINNAFATFFITAIYMQCWDWFIEGIKKRKIKIILKSMLVSLIPILSAFPFFLGGILSVNQDIPFVVIRGLIYLSLFIPNILTVEGGYILVLIGLLFYIFRNNRALQILVLFIVSSIIFILDSSNIQWVMVFGFIPMLLYNGKRGHNIKNFFYIFYPAHIWILYIISTFLSK